MSAGIVAFFVILAVLTACYAAFAPTQKIALNDDDAYLVDVKQPGLFDKWIRPAVRNFLPAAPAALTSYARESGAVASLLVRSGNPWRVSPEEFIVVKVLAAAVGATALSLYAALGYFPLSPVFAFLGGAVFGWVVPQLILSTAWGKRKKEIIRTLPESLDLLRICLNAGYNFSNALAQVVSLLPDGATRQELTRVVADLRSGRTVAQSMQDFAHRVPIDQVESFVRAVNIAQSMGTDMASTLATQSSEARAEYERVVEVKAQKLQTTLFLPIIGLFLPALMILIFGPSLTDLGSSL
jgi:tight adherence protein C